MCSPFDSMVLSYLCCLLYIKCNTGSIHGVCSPFDSMVLSYLCCLLYVKCNTGSIHGVFSPFDSMVLSYLCCLLYVKCNTGSMVCVVPLIQWSCGATFPPRRRRVYCLTSGVSRVNLQVNLFQTHAHLPIADPLPAATYKTAGDEYLRGFVICVHHKHSYTAAPGDTHTHGFRTDSGGVYATGMPLMEWKRSRAKVYMSTVCFRPDSGGVHTTGMPLMEWKRSRAKVYMSTV